MPRERVGTPEEWTVPLSQLNAPAEQLVTLARMTGQFRQLERLARAQAALTEEPRAKQVLLEMAEEYRRRAERQQHAQCELEPFPDEWWASPRAVDSRSCSCKVPLGSERTRR
jgi:hypothetical protein